MTIKLAAEIHFNEWNSCKMPESSSESEWEKCHHHLSSLFECTCISISMLEIETAHIIKYIYIESRFGIDLERWCQCAFHSLCTLIKWWMTHLRHNNMHCSKNELRLKCGCSTRNSTNKQTKRWEKEKKIESFHLICSCYVAPTLAWIRRRFF